MSRRPDLVDPYLTSAVAAVVFALLGIAGAVTGSPWALAGGVVLLGAVLVYSYRRGL